MEMNARNDVVTSPLNGRGRSLAAQQIAHAVVTEAHNKSARDRDRLPGMRLGKMGPVADYYVQEMG